MDCDEITPEAATGTQAGLLGAPEGACCGLTVILLLHGLWAPCIPRGIERCTAANTVD